MQLFVCALLFLLQKQCCKFNDTHWKLVIYRKLKSESVIHSFKKFFSLFVYRLENDMRSIECVREKLKLPMV